MIFFNTHTILFVFNTQIQ